MLESVLLMFVGVEGLVMILDRIFYDVVPFKGDFVTSIRSPFQSKILLILFLFDWWTEADWTLLIFFILNNNYFVFSLKVYRGNMVEFNLYALDECFYRGDMFYEWGGGFFNVVDFYLIRGVKVLESTF